MKHQKTILLQGKSALERMADLESRVNRIAALRPEGLGSRKSQVEIIIVSKGREDKEILPLLHAGYRVFGENRIQEAVKKWPALKKKFPDIILHLIGSLQTNKIDDALAVFDVIQTLDRKKLADKLFQRVQAGGAGGAGRTMPLFVQINTGSEEKKSGILPENADAFISYCLHDAHLPVRGLMCLPPRDQNPAPHFALLHEIARRHHLASLSMGMSGDFEEAILLGATHIRPGRIIFEARP